MRISDWSSDVCSSDLNPLVARRGDIAKPPPHSYSLEMLWIRTAALALVILVAIAGGWSMADAAAQNRHVTGSCHEEAAKHSTDDRAVQAGHVCIGCAVTMPRTALAIRGAAPRSAVTPSATATALHSQTLAPDTPPPRRTCRSAGH